MMGEVASYVRKTLNFGEQGKEKPRSMEPKSIFPTFIIFLNQFF